MSYTPTHGEDGTVNVSQAIQIFEQFEHSKQFWSCAVPSGMASNPREFIHPVPHLSFVHGREMVAFLRDRYEGMSAHHFLPGDGVRHRPRDHRALGSPAR